MPEETNWDSYALCYDELNKLTPYKLMMKGVVQAAQIKDRDNILDAACGTGNLAHYVKQKIPHCKARFTFVDLSSNMLQEAAKKYIHFNSEMQNHSLNNPLPYSDATFDTIISVNTLYAVESPMDTLRDFMRVLKREGKIILVTPKQGYSNIKILQSHVSYVRKTADTKRFANKDVGDLLVEAFPHASEQQMRIFQEVARKNELIVNDDSFHFFMESELKDLIRSIGFKTCHTTLTYAEQNIFLVAQML